MLLFSDRIFSKTEKQRHDGWFNNLAHPNWGSVGKIKKNTQKHTHYTYIPSCLIPSIRDKVNCIVINTKVLIVI